MHTLLITMSKIRLTTCFVTISLLAYLAKSANSALLSTSDSTVLNGFSITEYISKNGYPVEIHSKIQTEDNYLLTVHRIPHGRNKPSNNHTRPAVLLMHGMEGSAPNWIIMGPSQSLAFRLADRGYDVWMGNARGTSYSKKHVTLDSDRDDQYWDFSWHEIGYYDLPAMIHYILELTGQKQLFYVGHSQGTTSFFAMASSRPNMNAAVKLMVALAPGVFYMPFKMPIKSAAESGPYTALEMGRRLLGLNQLSTEAIDFTCAKPLTPFLGHMCEKLFKMLVRMDMDPAESERVRKIFPDTCSIRQLLHYVQLYISGEFVMYDFGKELNLKKYGSAVPPQYDLKRVTAPVALIMAMFDFMGLPLNVKRLEAKIQNVVLRHVIPDRGFNHFNFVIGNQVDELVNSKVFEVFSKYGQ